MRRVLGGVGLVALLAGAGYAGVSVYAASQLVTTGTHKALEVGPESVGDSWEDVAFPSRYDRLTLRGWLFRSPVATGRSAIAMHGFTSNRTDPGFGLPAFARDLLAAGYDTLLFDFRSSGLSDGRTFTIGWREGRDVLGAYDFMRERGYDPARMAIIGISLGADAMLGVADQLGPVAALVADSAYADLAPMLDLNLGRYSPLPRAFYPGVLAAGRLLFGMNPDYRPIDHVRALPGRAFLFLAGGRDDFVPTYNSLKLRAASANARTQVVIFEGSAHVQGYHDERERYLSVLLGFVEAQIRARAGADAVPSG